MRRRTRCPSRTPSCRRRTRSRRTPHRSRRDSGRTRNVPSDAAGRRPWSRNTRAFPPLRSIRSGSKLAGQRSSLAESSTSKPKSGSQSMSVTSLSMASRCDPTARARSAAFATTVSMSSPIPRIRRTGRRSSNVTRMSPYPAQSSLSPSSADLLGSSRPRLARPPARRPSECRRACVRAPLPSRPRNVNGCAKAFGNQRFVHSPDPAVALPFTASRPWRRTGRASWPDRRDRPACSHPRPGPSRRTCRTRRSPPRPGRPSAPPRPPGQPRPAVTSRTRRCAPSPPGTGPRGPKFKSMPRYCVRDHQPDRVGGFSIPPYRPP